MTAQRQTVQPAQVKPTSAGGMLQRQCACGNHTIAGGECEACRKKREGTLQRAAISSPPIGDVPPIVHEVLRAPGQPLDAATRAFMEPRFGHDFSGVQVHTDAKAAESARAVNALAYTVGRDVVFGAGRYAPERTAGQRLLAHELAHTIQQCDARPAASGIDIDLADSPLEREADRAAAQVVRGHTVGISGLETLDATSTPAVARAVHEPDRAGPPFDTQHRFGQDFAAVRVYADAAAFAQRVEPIAATRRRAIDIRQRKDSPATAQRRLLLNRNPALVMQRQQPGARRLMQRVGIVEFFSRLFFEGTFTEEELLSYLQYLDDHGAIEGSYDSDNKAREIIRRWRAGDPKFNPTLSQKQLMLLELIDGPTLDADEHAILELLRGSSEHEVRMLIGTAGGEEALRGEFHGSESDELDVFLADWHRDPRHRPVAADELGRRKVTITEVVVNQNSPQVVTVRYNDGRVETNTCSAGKGTCCVEPGNDAGPTAGETHVTDSNWTPVGVHRVQFTQADHDGIKWWTQFNSRGIALHQYDPVDGTPLSHGCVRLNADFAERINRGALSLRDVSASRATVVRVIGTPRPRCGHGALMHEWEKDFSEGAGRPTDGEAAEIRQHLRLAFGRVGDVELDRRIAIGVVPRCGGTGQRGRAP